MSGGVAVRGILFVGQDAGRYGSTIELLHFLRWFKENGTRPFSLLLDAGGELALDYAAITETWAAESSHWCPGGMRSRVLTLFGLGAYARWAEKTDVRRFAAHCSPALVYVNTVAGANSHSIDVLSPEVPVLLHVHEMEVLSRVHAGEALAEVLSRARGFISCSDAVKDYLIHNLGIEPDRVETVHEAIPVAEIRAERTRQQVFRELQIPDDALLVAACGSADWRKGPDLFIQLAQQVSRKRSSAYFAWIGGTASEIWHLEHDVRLARLMEKVRFTGTVAKPADYLASADVFVLTSREDPYPLVCLEAAALSKPIICFADAGGMPEFVEEDCGFVVPYLDIPAMAERVISLLDCQECRLRIGAAARRKVVKRHDIGVAGPRIVTIIERMIRSSETRGQ